MRQPLDVKSSIIIGHYIYQARKFQNSGGFTVSYEISGMGIHPKFKVQGKYTTNSNMWGRSGHKYVSKGYTWRGEIQDRTYGEFSR